MSQVSYFAVRIIGGLTARLESDQEFFPLYETCPGRHVARPIGCHTIVDFRLLQSRPGQGHAAIFSNADPEAVLRSRETATRHSPRTYRSPACRPSIQFPGEQGFPTERRATFGSIAMCFHVNAATPQAPISCRPDFFRNRRRAPAHYSHRPRSRSILKRGRRNFSISKICTDPTTDGGL